jgi:hypothetical protein
MSSTRLLRQGRTDQVTQSSAFEGILVVEFVGFFEHRFNLRGDVVVMKSGASLRPVAAIECRRGFARRAARRVCSRGGGDLAVAIIHANERCTPRPVMVIVNVSGQSYCQYEYSSGLSVAIRPAHRAHCHDGVNLERKENSIMDSSIIVRVVAGFLAVVCVAVIAFRRKQKSAQ